MSPRTLLLLAVLVLLGLGVAWLATRADEPHVPLDVTVAGGPHGPSGADHPAADLSAAAAVAVAEAAPLARSVAERAADVALFPDDVRWVQGRVVFPPGTPRDERAFVVATGRKFAGRVAHRFEVAPDGGFRAAFAPDAKTGSLDLDARYVFLAAPLKLDLRADAEVVLEPRLGGLVRARLVPTPTAAARGFAPASARLQASFAAWVEGDVHRPRSVPCDAGGFAELGGLDAAREWRLTLEAPGFELVGASVVAPKPGAVQEVDLGVAAASRLTGVVRDARGAPVPSATVQLETRRGSRPRSFVDWSSTSAGQDGRFEAWVGGTGTVEIEARRPGFLPARAGPFEATEGAAHLDLELRLEDGLAIAGFVRWPDGSPAVEAQVELRDGDDVPQASGSEQSTRTSADGAFHFGGLLEGRAYALASRVRAPGAPGAAQQTQRRWWSSARGAVPAGSTDVVLVLAAGGELRGRVVDDRGAPVKQANVVALPVGELAEARRAVSGRVSDEGGAFELSGVGDGEWRVGATRKGTQPAAGEHVLLPRDAGRELRLVLPRPAVVAGQVFDADGSPAADALVVAELAGDQRFGGEREIRAGQEGAFRLEELAPGRTTFHARRNDRADAEPVEIALEPGTEVAALVLRLRRGATVEGRVLDAQGRPRTGAEIQVHAGLRWDGRARATAGADGSYRIERVTPGRVSVSVHMPGDTTWAESKAVHVEEGAVARVDFGGPLDGRVLVRGLVRAGQPVAGADVRFHPMGNPGLEPRAAESDAAGRYELRLAEPGKYWATVSAAGFAGLSRQVQIPDVAEQVLDLDLGSGRIAGRVLDSEGRPLAGVHVQLGSESRGAEDSGFSGGFAQTEGDGRFDFAGLLPGTYTLEAGLQYGPAERTTHAPKRVTGVVLDPGGTRTDLEIRLERGGTLIVRVRDSQGAPAAGARVRWMAEARQLDVQADAAGIARLEGLPTGDVELRAWTEYEFQREPVRASARPGAPAEIQVELVRGGRVRLRLERGDGSPILEPWGYRHGVRDAAGRPLPQAWTPPGDLGAMSLGPFPPGRATVWARFGDREVSESVQIDAATTCDVILREPG
ncbi:MAG: carboxypeptidase regulatory-like domain-containing protein [Planctomycetes bacterium]|nr:carboxypeptidase regulatory-like domain-containing protein [Planctomycetota bacterium]